MSVFHLDGKAAADDIHQTLGMLGPFDGITELTIILVLMQQIASDINKSKRRFN